LTAAPKFYIGRVGCVTLTHFGTHTAGQRRPNATNVTRDNKPIPEGTRDCRTITAIAVGSEQAHVLLPQADPQSDKKIQICQFSSGKNPA
jgi:hypothetical protein